jgi:hypothetical protein
LGAEVIGMAASASLLAGWRLYLTALIVGLGMRWGWIALPDQLSGLEILANPWLLTAAGTGAAIEFLADKIMWVDSVWDGIHTVLRPIGGALLSLAVVDPAEPLGQALAFLMGGGAAFLTHAAKAATRLAVNASPEPFSNILVSTGEDVATAGLLALAIAYPVTAALVALALTALMIWLLIKLRRFVARLFRRGQARPAR